MDYVTMRKLESDRLYQQQVEAAKKADAEMRELQTKAMMAREKFFMTHGKEPVYFDTPEEKVEAIKEWYPYAYSILEEFLPNFVKMPNDMPKMVLKLAQEYVGHLELPADRMLLSFV